MQIIIKRPVTADYLTIPEEVWAKYEARGWVRVTPLPETPAVAEEPAPLRGKALDAALKSAGLSTKGTAAEKRARLAACDDTNADPEEKA